MRLSLEILFFVITVGILPVVINKSTEVHLDWVKRYLRELWFGIFAFFLIYWVVTKPEVTEGMVNLHKHLHGWVGYALAGTLGAVLCSAFWWFTGKVADPGDAKESARPEHSASNERQRTPPTTATGGSDHHPQARPTHLPFSAEIVTTFLSVDREHSTPFGLIARNERDTALYPVNVAAYIRIMNLQTLSTMISAYGLDVSTTDGEWIHLVHLPTVGTSSCLMFPGLAEAAPLLDQTAFLDRLLTGRNLQPREVVAGWAFFEYPKAAKPITYASRFRIRVNGTAGEVYVSAESGKTLETASDAIQRAGLSFGPKMDVSTLPKRYWNEP